MKHAHLPLAVQIETAEYVRNPREIIARFQTLRVKVTVGEMVIVQIIELIDCAPEQGERKKNEKKAYRYESQIQNRAVCGVFRRKTQ
jgi:hypothetical protein